MRKWSFLTNHAIVLSQIAKQPGSTLRQIALAVDLSYRALRKAIYDLDKDGYIIRKREGREFRYSINPELTWRQDAVRATSFQGFLEVLGWKTTRVR
jgi:DNA-binding transcriptional ArsR family regulator